METLWVERDGAHRHTRSSGMRNGSRRVYFPLLVPRLLDKENKLVHTLRWRENKASTPRSYESKRRSGFREEVYWVKQAGEHDLDVPMFLRPTSETPMYTMFSLDSPM